VKPAAEAHEQAECRPPDDGRTGAAPDEP